MTEKWNKEQYSLFEVSKKLSCKPEDLINCGLLSKLKIAAYIYIEKEKVRTYSLFELYYPYVSGFYYICYHQLVHFKYRDSVDIIEAVDIIPVITYQREKYEFYRYNKVKCCDNNSSFYDMHDELEFEIYNMHDYEIAYYESLKELAKEYNEDYDPSSALFYCDYDKNDRPHCVAYPDHHINYTIYRKDLLIYHNDLIEFFKNEPQYNIELNYVKGVGDNNGPDIASDSLTQNEPTKDTSLKKAVKSKSSLTEAIEYAYVKLIKNDYKEITRYGKPRIFLELFKKMATEGNKEEDDYVVERIKSVECPAIGVCKVTVKYQYVDKKTKLTDGKQRSYNMTRISQILMELRRNNNIHI